MTSTVQQGLCAFLASENWAHLLKVGRCVAAAWSSPTLFYIMSVTETEAFAPKLQGCLLSNLAGSLHHAFLSLRRRSSTCMAMQLEHAHIVLAPGYSVLPDVTRPLSFPGRSCAASQIHEGQRAFLELAKPASGPAGPGLSSNAFRIARYGLCRGEQA